MAHKPLMSHYIIFETLEVGYEEEFLGFSYGFRPKRGQHDALDALAVGITDTPFGTLCFGRSSPLGRAIPPHERASPR
jgi:hypothetical protein